MDNVRLPVKLHEKFFHECDSKFSPKYGTRYRIIEDYRLNGKKWVEIASAVSSAEGSPVSRASIINWTRKHIPSLVKMNKSPSPRFPLVHSSSCVMSVDARIPKNTNATYKNIMAYIRKKPTILFKKVGEHFGVSSSKISSIFRNGA